MLGKILKKNTVLPGGPGETPVNLPLPPPVIGKSFPTYRFTDFIVQYPFSSGLFFLLPLIILAFLSAARPITYNLQLSQFTLQHPIQWDQRLASVAQQAWKLLQMQQAVESPFDVGCNQTRERGTNIRHTPRWRIYLIYKPSKLVSLPPGILPEPYQRSVYDRPYGGYKKDTGLQTMLNPETLQQMHTFETDLLQYIWTQDVQTCWRTREMHYETLQEMPECVPPASILGYFYPGDKKPKVVRANAPQCTKVKWMWENSGIGEDQVDLLGAMWSLVQNPDWEWFLGHRSRPSALAAPVVRSQITFGTPINISSSFAEDEYMKRLMAKIDAWIRIHRKALPDVDVVWGGANFREEEIRAAFLSDWKWMALSYLVPMVALAYHVHSLFLGVSVLGTIFLTMPAATFLYRCFTGEQAISLMAILSHYAILAFILNSAFVSCTTFLQSGQMASHGHINMLSLRQRVAWMYRKAGVAVTVSSFVVLASLGPTLMVPIPAAASLGALTLLAVTLNTYMYLTVFPALLIWHHLHLSNKRRNTQRQRELLRRTRVVQGKRPEQLVSFLQDLWRLSPLEVRPHHKVKQNRTGLTVTPREEVCADDFRRCHRRPPEEFIARIPETLCYAETAEDQTAVVQKVAEVTGNQIEGDELDWSTVEWDMRRELLLRLSRELGIEASNDSRRLQVAQALYDMRHDPLHRQVMNQLHSKLDSRYVPPPIFSPSDNENHPVAVSQLPAGTAHGARGIGRLQYWAHDSTWGRFWRRVTRGQEETPEQKAARVKRGRTKREGYTTMERFFFNQLAPRVYKCRYLIIVIYLILFGVGLGMLPGSLKAQSGELPLLKGSSVYGQYHQLLTDYFGAEEPCERCGAYFQPVNNKVQECSRPFNLTQKWMMYTLNDQCKVCGGANDCLGCDGLQNSGKHWDLCGVCGGDSSSCTGCDGTLWSNYVFDGCLHCIPSSELAKAASEESCPPDADCSGHGLWDGSINACHCFPIYSGEHCGTCDCHNGGTCDGLDRCTCPTIKQGNLYYRRRRCAREGQDCSCHGVVTYVGPAARDGRTRTVEDNITCKSSSFGLDTTLTGGSCYCDEGYSVYSGYLCEECKCHPRGFCTPQGCRCLGMWSGPLCDECLCAPGQFCNELGQCRPCVMDQCRTCFGQDRCIAPKDDPAEAEWSLPTKGQGVITIDIYFGLRQMERSVDLPVMDSMFDFMALQEIGVQMCEQLSSKIMDSGSYCIFEMWQRYLEMEDYDFPQPSSLEAVQTFWDFVDYYSLWEYAAFNMLDRDFPNLRISWVRNSFAVPVNLSASPSEVLRRWEAWQIMADDLSKQASGAAGLSPDGVIQTSTYWVDAMGKLVTMNSAMSSLAISGIVAFFLMLAFTSSPILSLATSLTQAMTIVGVLGWMCIFKMQVGPTEALALAALTGMTSSLNVHMMEGYIEFVHSSRSHLLAGPLKRQSCIRGMLLRAGVPLTSSTLCVIFCSLVLLACRLQILVRIGQLLLLMNIIAIICALTLTPAILSICGPTDIIRTPKSRVIYFSIFISLLLIVVLVLWLARIPVRWPNGELVFYTPPANTTV